VSRSVVSITSRSNPLLVRLRKLCGDPAAYRKQGQVWIEGVHLCEAYVQHGGVPLQAVIAEPAWQIEALRALAMAADAVAIVPPALMEGLSTLESAPPLAFAVEWPGAHALRPGVPSVVLDRLQDAGNVGSILRSAAAFGVVQVIALGGTVALWSPKVVRAGQGAHFALYLVEAADAAVLDGLGVPLVATGSHADVSLDEATLPRPCAWVFGHEGQGVSPPLLEQCALTVRIPQPGGQESLNVAAAAGICLYAGQRLQNAQPRSRRRETR
jgi:RNA methyltransferase, TrmH family